MNEESVFTKIINGDISCHKVYEDERTFAFLDIHPIQPGHTLVVPKNQVEFVWDLEAADYHAVMETAQKVAKRLREVLGASYIGEQIIGTDVPHAHVHVFPFENPTEYRTVPDAHAEPDHEALAAMAKRLWFSE